MCRIGVIFADMRRNFLSVENFLRNVENGPTTPAQQTNTMTFKQFAQNHPDMTVGQLRQLWGKVSKALQDDMRARFGGMTGVTYKRTGKVRMVDGQAVTTLAAVKRVVATAPEIREERQRNADASARRDGKLAECEAEAVEAGRKGLDLVALVRGQDQPTPEPATSAS